MLPSTHPYFPKRSVCIYCVYMYTCYTIYILTFIYLIINFQEPFLVFFHICIFIFLKLPSMKEYFSLLSLQIHFKLLCCFVSPTYHSGLVDTNGLSRASCPLTSGWDLSIESGRIFSSNFALPSLQCLLS